MFGGPKIKLEKDLYDRVKRVSEVAGYSTADEFVRHVLEKEMGKIEGNSTSEEDMKKKLQGLGYIS